MSKALSQEAIEILWSKARSHHYWLTQEVHEDDLKKLYELAKWGPTSSNSCPGRFLFIKSQQAKERLYPGLMGSNVAQVKSAPVCVIVAQDMEFYEKLSQLAPHMPEARSWFAGKPAAIEATAFRNSSMQGAYFLLAARSLGFDVCPMSGFNNEYVDQEFFAGSTFKSNFIFTLGYGNADKLHPRAPRLDFDEACKII